MQLVGLRFFEFSMVVRKNTGSGKRKSKTDEIQKNVTTKVKGQE